MFKNSPKTITNRITIWQDALNVQTALGGFTLDNTDLADGLVIKAGTPINFDEATRLAKPLYVATVVEATSGTSVKVKKGHAFKTTHNAAKAVGGASYAINAIDKTTSADYDTLTLATALGALSVGDVLFQSSASGASAGAYAVVPMGLLYEDLEVEVNAQLDVVLQGTVYARRISVPAGIDTALKAQNAFIKFSQAR